MARIFAALRNWISRMGGCPVLVQDGESNEYKLKEDGCWIAVGQLSVHIIKIEAGSAGFQVWCTPEDHPQGWNDIKMFAGAFSKPCEFVGSVGWAWENEKLVGLQIETTAYALVDQMPEKYSNLPIIPKGTKRRSSCNREQDIKWLKKKIA